MNNQKKLENRKKLRHGTTAIILTAVVVAAVIIANIVFTKLAYANNWYVDMTKDKIYGLSDDGRALLDGIDSSREIEVHFCTPLDKLESNDYSKMVLELVKQISAEYPNVSYDYIDPYSTSAYKYKSDSTDSVSSDSIIVESGTEFRKYALNQMFIYDPSTYVYWAFDGEKRLVTAMVSVTQAESPIAYLSTGHGELKSTVFEQLLTDAGYEVRSINLATESFDPDARLLVIMNPLYDFAGDPENDPEVYSEVEKVADWLDDKGNLMVFRGGIEQTFTAPVELPELDALLAEWGLKFETATIYDNKSAIVTGAGSASYIIEGEYAADNSFGAGVVSEISSLSSPPQTVVPYARPIELTYTEKNDRQTSAVLYTKNTAVKNIGDTTVSAGHTPIIAASRKLSIDNNVEQYNYVYAIGSLNFADAGYINASYANSDVLYRMMRQMGRAQVPIDLEFKVFESEALNINISTATVITWVLVTAVPVFVFAVGTAVHIRRKHR